MLTISNISTRSRNAEVNETAASILAEFKKGDFSADDYLTTLCTEAEDENEELTLAIAATRASSQQGTADEGRDTAASGLFWCAEAAEVLPDTVISNAARAVNEQLEKYTMSILRLSYDEETSMIRSLLKDLEAIDEDVKKVPQLELHVEHLKQCQIAFDKAKDSYVEAQKAGKLTRSAHKIKVAVLELVNGKIIPYLNTMAQVNPEAYSSFADTCAELVGRNNQRVNRRRTSKNEQAAED